MAGVLITVWALGMMAAQATALFAIVYVADPPRKAIGIAGCWLI